MLRDLVWEPGSRPVFCIIEFCHSSVHLDLLRSESSCLMCNQGVHTGVGIHLALFLSHRSLRRSCHSVLDNLQASHRWAYTGELLSSWSLWQQTFTVLCCHEGCCLPSDVSLESHRAWSVETVISSSKAWNPDFCLLTYWVFLQCILMGTSVPGNRWN